MGEEGKSPNEKNRLVTVMRWVALFPVASVAAWVAYFALFSVIASSRGAGIFEWELAKTKMVAEVFGSLIMGATFVYVGREMAPSNKIGITYLLGGMCILGAGVFLFIALQKRDFELVLFWLFVSIGAGAVMRETYKHTKPYRPFRIGDHNRKDR